MRSTVKQPAKALPPPRVRREPPTVQEAITAAQGLTTDPRLQVEIAAGLMGVAEEEVRPFLPMPAARSAASPILVGTRTVLVERRATRSLGRRSVEMAARR